MLRSESLCDINFNSTLVTGWFINFFLSLTTYRFYSTRNWSFYEFFIRFFFQPLIAQRAQFLLKMHFQLLAALMIERERDCRECEIQAIILIQETYHLSSLPELHKIAQGIWRVSFTEIDLETVLETEGHKQQTLMRRIPLLIRNIYQCTFLKK